jgi:DHA2 family methylenomycin A resistance protein-like MFS transporter
MLPGQLLIRAGIGLVVPPMTTAVLSTVDRTQSGIASGLLNAVRQTGGAVGVAVFGALMATDMVWGVRIALVVSAGLLVIATVIAVAGIQNGNSVDSES